MDDKVNLINSLKEKELAEAFTTIRTIGTLYTQLVGAFIAANVAVVGFAISHQNIWYVLFGGIFPVLILTIRYACYKSMIPIGYFIYSCEQKLSDSTHEFLAQLYLNSLDSKNATEFKGIFDNMKDVTPDAALKKLCSINNILFSADNKPVSMLCILTSSGQVFAFVLFHYIFLF